MNMNPQFQALALELRNLLNVRNQSVEQERAARMLPGDDKALRECEESLVNFVGHAWHILEPKKRILKTGWAIDAMADHLEAVTYGDIKNLLINVPPGTLKSLLTKVFWPAWEWGPMNMAHLRYVTASYAKHLSARDSRKLKILVESEWYQRLWPHVKLARDQHAKTNFHTTQMGFVVATSVGGVGTGERGDRFICFPREQIVQTENGSISIGDIVERRMAVKVWSTNIETGETSLKPITGWHKNPSSLILKINFSDGAALRCTPDHKIWTHRGWVEAQDLKASDRLPDFAFADISNKTPMNIIFLGKRITAFFGIKNFQNLFWRQFCMGASISSAHITDFSIPFGNIPPCPSHADMRNRCKTNAIEDRKIKSGLIALNNFNNFFLRQFGVRPVLMQRECAVRLGIGDILRPRSIFQIFKNVVQGVPVKMPHFHSLRRRSDKGKQYDLMNENMPFSLFIDHIKAKISFAIFSIVRGLQYSFRYFIRKAFANSHAFFRANAPLVTDTVKTLPFRDRFPVFIRRYGHADSTFCLSVEGNNTFWVGKSHDECILVSNCDDPNSVKEAESEAVRESTNLWRGEVVPTRINDPEESAIIDIQQRTNEHDVTGYLLENKPPGLVHLCLPMEYDPKRHCSTIIGFSDPRTKDGELLFPERFSAETVAHLKKQLGPFAASAQLQQAPVPRGGSIINIADWKIWKQDDNPPLEFIIASLDTAYTEEEENDYSALTVWGVFRDSQTRQPMVILLRAWEGREKLNNLVKKVAEICQGFGVQKLLIEAKAAGHPVAQELRRLFASTVGVILITVMGGRGKPSPIIHRGDKAARAYTVQHIWTNGQVWMPDKQWAQKVAAQLASVPKGHQDDLADTATMAVRYLRDTGFLLTPAEGTGEVEIFGKALRQDSELPYDV